MATDIIISTDNSTNTTLGIYDSTDYTGLGISISDVKAVRFLFSTYNSVLNSGTVGALIANNEYLVITGSFVMDGILYSSGDVFVARQAFTLPVDPTLLVSSTGYYSTYNTLTPSTITNYNFYPSDLNENSTTFADSARTVNYEIYTTESAAGTIAAGTYIVKGTPNTFITITTGTPPNQTIEYYYVGQVFTKSTSFTFTGTPTVVKSFDENSFDFWTNAASSVIYQSYVNSLSNSTLNASEDFKDNFIRTNTLYSLPYVQSATSIAYDFSAVQASLDIIVNYLGTKNKNVK
jgi:hypothetical protein